MLDILLINLKGEVQRIADKYRYQNRNERKALSVEDRTKLMYISAQLTANGNNEAALEINQKLARETYLY